MDDLILKTLNRIEAVSLTNTKPLVITDTSANTGVDGYAIYTIADATFTTILSHYRDVSGTFQAFYWTTVPSYIDGGDGSGVSMYGRWVGKPSWKPNSRSWNVTAEFEKNI